MFYFQTATHFELNVYERRVLVFLVIYDDYFQLQPTRHNTQAPIQLSVDETKTLVHTHYQLCPTPTLSQHNMALPTNSLAPYPLISTPAATSIAIPTMHPILKHPIRESSHLAR